MKKTKPRDPLKMSDTKPFTAGRDDYINSGIGLA